MCRHDPSSKIHVMTARPEPRAQSTCRLCKVGQATVRFTDDSNVIDVECPKCGQFRVEIPGYHIDLNGLTGDQRLKLIAYVEGKHSAGDSSPLITRELLVEVVGID